VPVRRFSVRSAVSFRWTSMGTWNWNLGAMVPGAGSKKQPCFTKKAVLLGWNVLRLPRPINHLALLLKQTTLTRILDYSFQGLKLKTPSARLPSTSEAGKEHQTAEPTTTPGSCIRALFVAGNARQGGMNMKHKTRGRSAHHHHTPPALLWLLLIKTASESNGVCRLRGTVLAPFRIGGWSRWGAKIWGNESGTKPCWPVLVIRAAVLQRALGTWRSRDPTTTPLFCCSAAFPACVVLGRQNNSLRTRLTQQRRLERSVPPGCQRLVKMLAPVSLVGSQVNRLRGSLGETIDAQEAVLESYPRNVTSSHCSDGRHR
jgi:hypothetical protein